MIDHRRHPRFHLLHTTARSGELEAEVLNLSRSGMMLETPAELEVGDALFFEISDRNHQLEVAAEVRWSRPPGSVGETCRAGVQFSRVITAGARGVWARLVAESGETGLPSGHRPESSSIGRVPLLTILFPEDGAVVQQAMVSVIGQVRDPGLGSMVEVNGVPALIYGRRFEARVELAAGPNLLSAAVATRDAAVCRSRAVRVTLAPPSP